MARGVGAKTSRPITLALILGLGDAVFLNYLYVSMQDADTFTQMLRVAVIPSGIDMDALNAQAMEDLFTFYKWNLAAMLGLLGLLHLMVYCFFVGKKTWARAYVLSYTPVLALCFCYQGLRSLSPSFLGAFFLYGGLFWWTKKLSFKSP